MKKTTNVNKSDIDPWYILTKKVVNYCSNIKGVIHKGSPTQSAVVVLLAGEVFLHYAPEHEW